MALTHAQQLNFSREILEILKINQEKMAEEDVDVSRRIEELEAEIPVAEKAEANQQQAESKARTATKIATTTREGVYKKASADVELIVGTFGKDDSLVLEVKNLRDEMNN